MRLDALSPTVRGGWDLEWLANTLGFASRASMCACVGAIEGHGYTVFARSRPGKRRRVITAPKGWLKEIQRRAAETVFSQLPISDAVYDCRGRGVVANSRKHLGRSYVTTLDIHQCYASTSVSLVSSSLISLGIRESVAHTLTALTTHHGFLPQGSPASPSVLNVVFRPIDEQLSLVASRYEATFTRFGDDLAFSADSPLRGLGRSAAKVLARFGYSLNPAKCHYCGPNDCHVVTGIVVNSRMQAPPKYITELTRRIDVFTSGGGNDSETKLRSSINWVSDLNPDQARWLSRRLDANRE